VSLCFKYKGGILRALLLAAGLGTRLRPLTNFIPKCLVPVNGRPLLEYWLRYLSEADITPLLVNLHSFADVVKTYLLKSLFAQQVSTIYEETLLGTGGTLLQNRKFFREEALMLIHADNLCLCDFKRFVQSHYERPSDTDITMMTFTTPTPKTCGIVELDERGVVQAFHEKVQNPPGNLGNAAVYILEPSVVDFLAGLQKPMIDFSTDVLPHYVGRIATYHNAVYHRDIGNIESLMAAQIECPQPNAVPEGNKDWWRGYFGANSLTKARDVMLALSEVLGAVLYPLVPERPCYLLHDLETSKNISDSVLLVADQVPLDLRTLVNAARERFSSETRIILLFHRVPPGFSSKELFETIGLDSFAICACEN
jgi:mannose-1-phosphate guanylyltransferase